MIARSQLRRRRAAVVVLTVVVGLVGGLTLALVLGARRSSTVVERYEAEAVPYDVLIYAPALAPEQVRALPNVVRGDLSAYVGFQVVGAENPLTILNANAIDLGNLDGAIRVVDGRAPDGSDPSEVLINREAADTFGLGVGERFDARAYGPEQVDDAAVTQAVAGGPTFRFVVSGIIQAPSDLAANHVEGRSQIGNQAMMALSWEVYERHRHAMADFGWAMSVQLRDPAHVEGFLEDLRARSAAASGPDGGPREVYDAPPMFRASFSALDAPVAVETGMLWLLAGLAGGAGAVVLGLLLRAELRALRAERSTLATLGLSRAQLGLVGELRSTPIAVGGALVAVAFAIGTSARFPVGIGRDIEPDPGLQAPPLALLVGGVLVAVVTGAVALAVELLGRTRPGVAARGRVGRRHATFGGGVPSRLPASASLGGHLAFGAPGGRGRGIVWLPVIGGILAVASLAAGTVAAAGLAELYHNGPRHGFAWDAVIGNVNFELTDELHERVLRHPAIASATPAMYADGAVDGRAAELLALDMGTAEGAAPTIVDGRLPRGPGEVALGAAVLRSAGASIGDTVLMSLAGSELDTGEVALRDVPLRVVGVTVLPILGGADLGEHILVDLPAVDATGAVARPQLLVASFRSDIAEPDALAALERDFESLLTTDVVPSRVASLWEARQLPWVGACVLAGLGALLAVSTLASLGRLRARDIAVLRSLGLDGRGVRAATTWQAGALTGAVLLIGVPVGILGGLGLWRAGTTWLGVPDGSPVPARIALAVPVTLAALWAVTQLSARRSRRAQLAEALRAE